MASGKKLCTFVDVDDSTPVQKLSVLDQLRVLLHQLTYDDATELKNQDAVEQEKLVLKADLLDFLHKASEPIRLGNTTSVTVRIASKFLPVLDDAIRSPTLTSFYTVEVARPKIQYDLPFDVLVRLTVKEAPNEKK